MLRLPRLLAPLGILAVLLAGNASAQFVHNTTNVPTTAVGHTENVDFGDVDNDGDWDAIFADGGDEGNQQNRIWINQGGAQGGALGTFLDRTSTQLPAFIDDSRDVEFADIDKDGDLDFYVSNTSAVNNQPNHWLINMGGAQGGTIGFYQNQDSTHWMNVGVNNGTTIFSSVAASQVLPGGGFIDWSCDCDFADLDNDGDLDLVHSSYGGVFGGDVPTRLFRNNGVGQFEEFNPSHFQLTGSTIANGNPGIWAAGTQTANTMNTTGANCDVASNALGVELGDIDGDLDIDILHGARGAGGGGGTTHPRMFVNRFEEDGGSTLGFFRDVTGSAYPSGYATGEGHYEQEMGDLDNDGDLDIYGLNWLVNSGLHDITLENTGNGVYINVVQLSGSQSDDNEGDFLDYDMDGDLDLTVANFGGQERMYRNNYAGAGFSYTNVTSTTMPTDFNSTLDSDACDVDHDGDTDIFCANDGGVAEWYLQNTSTANDTFAPALKFLEQAPNRSAGPDPTVIRVMVYDNAPYYITWYNATVIEYSVDGGAFTPLPMMSSQGQIFRGELPGALVGTIDYRVKSTDKYGNNGTSVTKTYIASAGCTGTPTTYCTAKANSLNGSGSCPNGVLAIGGVGVPSATASSGFTISAVNSLNNKIGIMIYKNSVAGSAMGAQPFAGGTLCLASGLGPNRTTPVNSAGTPPPANDCSGIYAIDMNTFARGLIPGPPLPQAYLSSVGQEVVAQFWGRDPGFPPPNNVQLSNGLRFTICP